MSDPLEHFVDVLRQPGTTGELAGESHAVDALASSLTSQKGSPVKSTSGRRMRVASFIAAGVIGFGGVAAAGPGTFSDDSFEETVSEIAEQSTETTAPETTAPDQESTETTAPETTEPDQESTETTAPETTEPDQESTETTVPPSTEVPSVEEPDGNESEAPVDDPDTVFDERECADGNHGKTVSSVARTEGRTAEDVRNAAHSSCGKKTDEDGESEDPEEPAPENAAETEVVGKGNANGKNTDSHPGKGNANGKKGD